MANQKVKLERFIPPELFRELAEQVNRFDFKSALKTLDTIAQDRRSTIQNLRIFSTGV